MLATARTANSPGLPPDSPAHRAFPGSQIMALLFLWPDTPFPVQLRTSRCSLAHDLTPSHRDASTARGPPRVHTVQQSSHLSEDPASPLCTQEANKCSGVSPGQAQRGSAPAPCHKPNPHEHKAGSQAPVPTEHAESRATLFIRMRKTTGRKTIGGQDGQGARMGPAAPAGTHS